MRVFVKVSTLVLSLVGCAVKPTLISSEETKVSNKKECENGAEIHINPVGIKKCTQLKDQVLIIDSETLKKKIIGETAYELVKALDEYGSKDLTETLLKHEVKNGGLFFLVDAPCKATARSDGHYDGFFCKHKETSFFMNTGPYYYTKKFEWAVVRCSFGSAQDRIIPMLVFRDCLVVEISKT